MKQPKWYRRPLYALFVIIRISIQILPLRVIQWCGKGLGTVAWWCLREQRTLALAHLDQSLAQLPGHERRSIARRMFQHLGMNGLEWLAFPKFTAETTQRLVRVTGGEHAERALADGKGIIFLSAHFGNWELLAAYFGLRGFRGGVVARRLRYPEYEAWFIEMRRRKGVETFVRDGASFKELVRRLKENQCIGLMPDQDVDSLDGTFVEFFGRPTYTPTGPAALALLTGAVLIPVYIIREGARFHIALEPPVAVSHTGDRVRDIADMTQRWSRVTERYIRQYPDHWVWMHRRWKTQPAAQPVETPS